MCFSAGPGDVFGHREVEPQRVLACPHLAGHVEIVAHEGVLGAADLLAIEGDGREAIDVLERQGQIAIDILTRWR